MKVIAEKGRSAFYEGDIAQIIVAYLQNNGSFLTLADFKEHRGEWAEPVSTLPRVQRVSGTAEFSRLYGADDTECAGKL